MSRLADPPRGPVTPLIRAGSQRAEVRPARRTYAAHYRANTATDPRPEAGRPSPSPGSLSKCAAVRPRAPPPGPATDQPQHPPQETS